MISIFILLVCYVSSQVKQSCKTRQYYCIVDSCRSFAKVFISLNVEGSPLLKTQTFDDWMNDILAATSVVILVPERLSSAITSTATFVFTFTLEDLPLTTAPVISFIIENLHSAINFVVVFVPKDFLLVVTSMVAFVLEGLLSAATFVITFVLKDLPSAVTSVIIFTPESLAFAALG